MNNVSGKIFFVSATMLLVGCKKDIGIDASIDSRNKLEGSYNCVVYKNVSYAGTLVSDTTYYDKVNVKVDYSNGDKNSIVINDVLFTGMIVGSNYYEWYNTISQFNRKHVKFINDSLFYDVTSGTNGGATGYSYKGRK